MRRIEIRTMELDDLPEVYQIEQQSYEAPWSWGIFQQELKNTGYSHYITGRLDGELVAYGGLWFVLREAHVTNLAVHPSYRRQGLGTATLLSLCLSARRHGCRVMTLEVRVTNEAAVGLYQAFGFEHRGIRPGYYLDNGEDALIMYQDQLQNDHFDMLLERQRAKLAAVYNLELAPATGSVGR